MKPPYSPVELQIVVLARDLADGEVGFMGGANSVTSAAACLLARALYAPNLTIIQPSLFVNPDPVRLLPSIIDGRYQYGAEAVMTWDSIFEMSERGVDFMFYSGLEVDRFGNFNVHWFGGTDKPQYRGPGLVNVSWTTTANRYYLYPNRHDSRRLVEKVEFVSGVGNLTGGEARLRAGINTEGPRLCVTPRAVFDFDSPDRSMRLVSIHEGWELEDVLEPLPFQPHLASEVAVTEPPTRQELIFIRNLDGASLLGARHFRG